MGIGWVDAKGMLEAPAAPLVDAALVDAAEAGMHLVEADPDAEFAEADPTGAC